MWARLVNHQGSFGVIVLGLVFMALFFVLQTIVPLIMALIRRTTSVAYAGAEILTSIQENNKDQITVKKVKYGWRSPFHRYAQQTQTISLSDKQLGQENLENVFQLLTSNAFVKEKRHQVLSFSWQLWTLTIASFFVYLFGLATILLIMIPDPEVFQNVAGDKYYLIAEACAILGFVTLVITSIWWSFAVQPLELSFEEDLKKINNKLLTARVLQHFKVCSYLPFSFRLLI